MACSVRTRPAQARAHYNALAAKLGGLSPQGSKQQLQLCSWCQPRALLLRVVCCGRLDMCCKACVGTVIAGSVFAPSGLLQCRATALSAEDADNLEMCAMQ